MSKLNPIGVVLLFLLACASSGSARAQGGTPPAEKGTSATDAAPVAKAMVDAKGRKITVVNFDDALIEGKARGPDGFILRSRQSGSFRSILELRRDFRAEVNVDGGAMVPVVPVAP